MLIPFFHRIFNNLHTAELLRGGVYAVFFRTLSFLAGLLITSLIVSYYGLESYGTYTLILALWAVGAFAGRFSLDTVLNKFITQLHTSGEYQLVKPMLKRAMRISLFTSAGVAAAVFLFAEPFATYFLKNVAVAPVIRYSCWLIIPVSAGMILQGGLRALKKVKSFTFSNLASNNLIVLALLPLAILLSDHFFTPVMVSALAAILVFIIAQVLWTKNTKGFNHGELTRKENNLLLTTAWPVFLSSVWAVINQYTPSFMLGYFTDVSQVGLLEGSYRLSKLINIGFFLVNTLAAAKFAELLQHKNKEELQRLLQQKAFIISGVGLAFFLLFLFVPGFLLHLLNERFTVASGTLLILGCGQLVNALVGSVGVLMIMAGYEKQLMRIHLLGALGSITFSWLLIPSLHLEGAAFARSIGIILVNISCCMFLYQRTGLKTFYWPVKKRKETEAS